MQHQERSPAWDPIYSTNKCNCRPYSLHRKQNMVATPRQTTRHPHSYSPENAKDYIIFIKMLINHEIKTNSLHVLFMHTGNAVISFKFVQCVFLKDYVSH